MNAEEYFTKNYGKRHLERCIELNDTQSIYALMEEFADSEVKNLTIPVVSTRTWEFSYDEQFDCIEMTLEVPNNKDPYDVLLEQVPEDVAPRLWYRCI